MPFQITVSPLGETFTAELDETLLAAAKKQGVALPHACQSGHCGSCKAHLHSGTVSAVQVQHALSATDVAAGQILLCCTSAQSDVVVELPGYQSADAIVPQMLPAKITTVALQGDYAVLTLALPKNKAFRFMPGQYVDVLLTGQHRRSYSIAAFDEAAHTLQLHVRHHRNGLFSEAVFSGNLQEGSIIRLQAPLGSFALQESAKPILMLATGTGIAPIKAMLAELAQTASQRQIRVYWGMAHENGFYDAAAIQAVLAQLTQAQLHRVVSRPSSTWSGRQGHVQDWALAELPDLSTHEVYACGNPRMIEAARARFVGEARLPETAFFADGFTATTHII